MAFRAPNRQSTTLSEFGRTIRDEPFYMVYDHKVWLESGKVKENDVLAWLRKRYAEAKEGNRYRVVSYAHSDGQRYVDYILLENVKDMDLMYMKMRWGWSKEPVKREGKTRRRRMNSDQKKLFDARVEQLREEFLNNTMGR